MCGCETDMNHRGPLSKAFLALVDSFGSTHFIHKSAQCNGNTLNLVLSKGIAVSDLTVFPATSAETDYFLIKF